MRSSVTPGCGAVHTCSALCWVPVSKINVRRMTPEHGVPVQSFRTPWSTRNPAAVGSDGANCAVVSHAASTATRSTAAQATRSRLVISAIGKPCVFLGLIAAGDLFPPVGGEEFRVAFARPLLGVALLVVQQPVRVESTLVWAVIAFVPCV